MALHTLTPDERSRFENQMAELTAAVTLIRTLMLNFKDKAGNDTALGDAMKDVKDRIDAISTLIGVAVSS